MKILQPHQIREVDQYTIQNKPIPSIDLMENAAQSVVDWISKNCMANTFYIFCGTGNNGGDGLAIARLLHNFSVSVHVILVRFSNSLSKDAEENLNRLKEIHAISILEIHKEEDFNILPIDEDAIVIDAIFGSGLNRPTAGLAKEVIKKINALSNLIIAIDIPSGLFANKPFIFLNQEGIVKADISLSFQLPKLAFLLPENSDFVGKWYLLDIGLLEEGIERHQTNFYLTTKQGINKIIKSRKKFSHKGNYGHALLVAGSYGKLGAAILASKACLKAGVGLLTTHIPHWGYQVMQSTVPEAMTSIDRSEMIFTEFPELSPFNAIGIGPGLDTKKNSVLAFEELLNKLSDQKCVIDADGLNILSKNNFLLLKLPKNTILTPHPKEFERLAGKWDNDIEKLEILKSFCQKYNVVTVLKGAHTVVALPDGSCHFNFSGNPGMATAGSGDTLTGIILALLAQGYLEKDAAILGVYLHGLAGDIALQKESEESLIASDIICNLGPAFNQLRKIK